MMFPLLMAATLAAAAPFQDTRGRFALELPEGWGLSPRFGDTDGMRFERRLSARMGGGVAHLSVQVRPELDPEAGARADAAALAAQGYQVRRGAARVGGQAALRVTAERGGQVIRDDHIPGFMLRLEVAARDRRAVSKEVKAILRSFRARGAAPAAPKPPPAPAPGALEGRFESDVGTVLSLDGQGGFQLGASAGRYVVRGDALTLTPDGGAAQTFRYQLDGEVLVLTAPALTQPMRYRRQAPPRSASPAGAWRTAGPDGELRLTLHPDGHFELAGQTGQWMVETPWLRLRRSDTEVVSYHFTLSDQTLRLSGGDLDDEVAFTRVRP